MPKSAFLVRVVFFYALVWWLVAPGEAAAASVAPVLVEDLNSETGVFSSEPSGFVELGGIAYFSAVDPQHGRELWRSDGSEGGTWLVSDLCPGPCSSLPADFVEVGEQLFFSAEDATVSGSGRFVGRELWVTDGTTEGTRMVKDLCRGRCGGEPRGVALGELFVFTASDQCGLRLWVSDGTTEGTRRLLQAASCPTVQPTIVRLEDRVLFGFNGDLWSTDGTAAGTNRLKRVRRGAPGPTGLAVAGNRAYFHFDDSETLWITDGSAEGTRPLAQLGVGIEFGPSFAELDGETYFKFSARGSNGDLSCPLWRTDGTAEGTRLVVRLPGRANIFCLGEMLAHQGRLYFGLLTEAEGTELWSSDGSVAGTHLLRDILPGIPSGLIGGYTPRPDGLYFIARYGLWRTNGTPAGTEVVFESGPAERGIYAARLIGDRWFFHGSFGRDDDELWTSTGSLAGLEFVANLAGDAASAEPILLVADDGLAYLTAVENGLAERSTWTADGTAGSLSQLAPYAAGEGAVFGDQVVLSSGGLVFTDGTASGTQLVGSADSASDLTVVGEKLYFGGDVDGSFGVEPWTSDGTETGTALIQDLEPDEHIFPVSPPFLVPNGSYPAPFVRAPNGAVLFSATDQEHGRELWISDGSAAGTERLMDLWPGEDGSSPEGLVRLPQQLLFAASTANTGRELWTTDGSVDGTRLLADLAPGLGSSNPADFVVMDEISFFATRSDSGHAALWRSDGSAEGTVRLVDLGGFHPATLDSLTVAGERLFFVAFTPETGRELWVSGGSAETTFLVSDLFQGPAGSRPNDLLAVGDQLVFSASDGRWGKELWASDGTSAGTRRLTDIAAGSRSSSPDSLTVVGERILFSAADRDRGRELWSLELAALATVSPALAKPQRSSLRLAPTSKP